MANLGNRYPSMRLQCKPCGWVPPAGMTTRDAQLHFQVDHDTDAVTFDLVAVCDCGEAMTVTESRHISAARVQDYLACGVCGNTGYVRREAT